MTLTYRKIKTKVKHKGVTYIISAKTTKNTWVKKFPRENVGRHSMRKNEKGYWLKVVDIPESQWTYDVAKVMSTSPFHMTYQLARFFKSPEKAKEWIKNRR